MIVQQPPATRGGKVRRVSTLWATKRTWLPFAAAALCLWGVTVAGAIVGFILIVLAAGFVLDGATLLWSRGGGLTSNRQ